MIKMILATAVAVAISAQAQQPRGGDDRRGPGGFGERGDRGDRGATFTVNERQLDFLLEMANRVGAKAENIRKDFGTPEVMPRDRDRRDFNRDMMEIQPTEMVARWIERVKKGEHNPPPVVVPVLPAPADVTLTESFVLSSGNTYYYENDFKKAADAMAAQCAAWRESVTKASVGTVTYGQCSGAEQAKLEDGNIGAKVTGSIKLSFAKYTGYVAPKTLTATFSNNSGNTYYYANDFAKASAKSQAQCAEWSSLIRTQSKGLILYVSCGAVSRAKGFGGNLYANLVGTVAYAHAPTASQPTVLNQDFTNSSGNTYYYENDFVKAAASSRQQCLSWVTDTLKSSSAVPAFVSCNGPELVQGSNVSARYTGQIILLTP